MKGRRITSQDDYTPDTAPVDQQDFIDNPEPSSFDVRPDLPMPPHPINWIFLTATSMEAELLELNWWMDWPRRTYRLPASVIPPIWQRHPELLWALSSQHLSWLAAHDPEQNAAALFGCHHDFAEARPPARMDHCLWRSPGP